MYVCLAAFRPCAYSALMPIRMVVCHIPKRISNHKAASHSTVHMYECMHERLTVRITAYLDACERMYVLERKRHRAVLRGERLT